MQFDALLTGKLALPKTKDEVAGLPNGQQFIANFAINAKVVERIKAGARSKNDR